MAGDTNFRIPITRADLLKDTSQSYVVNSIISTREINEKLKDAAQQLREEGPSAILQRFDTYFSLLHHGNAMQINVKFAAYKSLLAAVVQLNNEVQFVLNNLEDPNEGLRERTLNILQMMMYIFAQFVVNLEEHQIEQQAGVVNKNKKNKVKTNDYEVDKAKVIQSLSNILCHEINLLWVPPTVESSFLKLFADILFIFLQNPEIKLDKNLLRDMFGLMALLIKTYNYGEPLMERIIHFVRFHEHSVHVIPNGIKQIVETNNCDHVVPYLVKSATEWQQNENIDNQGGKSCATILCELSALLPQLMLQEVGYLNSYLCQEPHTLRISVIHVMSEVISHVLTKHDLTDLEKESRDEFLSIILEHCQDVNAHVRTKVLNCMGKLQKENSIPLSMQSEVLEKAVGRLDDKASLVRKAAAGCVTTFLEYNLFGAQLELEEVDVALTRKQQQLDALEATYKEAKLAHLEELQTQFSTFKDDLKQVIREFFDNNDEEDDDDDDEEEEEERAEEQMDKDQMAVLVKVYMGDRKLKEAFKMCRRVKKFIPEWKNMKKAHIPEAEVYLLIMESMFMNVETVTDELRVIAGMTEDDCKRIKELEKSIAYYTDMRKFLDHIDTAVDVMKKLLFSPMVSDMQEAISFFVEAHNFHVRNSYDGVLEMLKLMQHSDTARREAVVKAFKTIQLVTTNAQDLRQHTKQIVDGMIRLLRQVSVSQYAQVQSIVASWTAKGDLDNSVIEYSWRCFTGNVASTMDERVAVAELLKMAAMGRSSILERNVQVVTHVALSDGKEDMLFLAACCELLAVAGREKIDITNDKKAFKIKHQDPFFQSLVDLLVEEFVSDAPYYSKAQDAAIDAIFRVCTSPIIIANTLVQRAYKLVDGKFELVTVTRFCRLLGTVAVSFLNYMDSVVYRELKRRDFLKCQMREAKKEQQNMAKKARNNRRSALSVSTISINANDETVVDGAEAVDIHSNFVVDVLDKEVLRFNSLLGQLGPFLIKICERPAMFSSKILQHSAVTALIRFMLLSSKFCSDNIRLLFTILKESAYTDIQCQIMLHFSDLLTRFPNIAEPWAPRIVEKLKDPRIEIRKTALYILSGMILKDMVRPHNYISDLAACLVDPNEELNQICFNFFRTLSAKESNLVNEIPDIFSHLVNSTETISDEQIRFVMKFLFDLIEDKAKKMENLVDRFCGKFSKNSENPRLDTAVAFCLTLVSYNEKLLGKLRDQFASYRYHVHNQEIYGSFQSILDDCSKEKKGRGDLKPIVGDIEKLISSVFETGEDGRPMRPPVLPRTVKKAKSKKGNPGRPSRKKSRRHGSDDDDSDYDDGQTTRSSATSTPSTRRKT